MSAHKSRYEVQGVDSLHRMERAGTDQRQPLPNPCPVRILIQLLPATNASFCILLSSYHPRNSRLFAGNLFVGSLELNRYCILFEDTQILPSHQEVDTNSADVCKIFVQGVRKMCARRAQDVCNTCARRLQDVCKILISIFHSLSLVVNS